MSQVISLASFRRKKRRAYLAKHGGRIDRTVEGFIRANIDIDFRQLAADYQAGHRTAEQECWDYIEFREVLAEALDKAFGETIYATLAAQPWFDEQLITQDEIIERCVSIYVLGRAGSAGVT